MAQNTLIIVESPTKARTLSRFLGSGFRIEASMGHVRDLPEKKLGIDINDGFIPSYEVPAKKRDIVSKLRRAAQVAKQVILATDPDREGEAIAWHIHYLLTRAQKRTDRTDEGNVSRIVFHEITKSAIESALQNPHGIDLRMVDAQQGRRVLDRLVGYKLSPLLWYKTGKNWLSAGRVQSVAVRLIVEREREIKAFIPEEFWEISALVAVKKDKKLSSGEPDTCTVKLVKIEGKTAEVKNKEHADQIIAELTKAAYRVSKVEKSPVFRHAAPPFITSSLQRTAATNFGWPARKTMTIAQNLYEEGLITYHRTDSVQLSNEALSKARSFILAQYGKDYLPAKPNFYKTTSKVAQEAHEAIRPTQIGKGKSEAGYKLGKDHGRLLDIITKRFLASQMVDQRLERTTIEVAADRKYLLRTSCENEVFPGWRILYERKAEETVLPDVAVDEALDLLKLVPEQKFTQPSARYNEASLIKALEQAGIGRPSTYAPIIHTIQLRHYVEKNESKAFVPTDLGILVNDFLVEHFNDIINVAFTAEMEDKLDDIAKGTIVWIEVIKKFWTPFEKMLLVSRSSVERVKVPDKKTGEKCPEDGGELVEKIGRYGKFLACSNFPTCKFTKPIVVKIDKKCPTCGGDIIVRKTKKGRKFFGCSNYPTCTFASWQKPK